MRDLFAQPFFWSPRRESRTRTHCETLQLSPGRGGPAWARLAGSRVCSGTRITPLCPICSTNNTKTQLTHYQAQIMAIIIRTGPISSIQITQLEIKSYLPIPYQNPPSNHNSKSLHTILVFLGLPMICHRLPLSSAPLRTQTSPLIFKRVFKNKTQTSPLTFKRVFKNKTSFGLCGF